MHKNKKNHTDIEEIKNFYKNITEFKKFSKIIDNKEKMDLYLEIRAIIILLFFTLNNYLWDFIFDQDPKNPEKNKIDSVIETLNYLSLDDSSSFSLYNIEFEKQIVSLIRNYIKNKNDVDLRDFKDIYKNCDTLCTKEFQAIVNNFSGRNTKNENLIEYFQRRLKQKIDKFCLISLKKKVKDDVSSHC